MRPTRAFRIFLAFLCPLAALALHAQMSITPQKIVFAGAPQYSQADMLKVSSLTAGSPVNADSIRAAATNLNNTGLFSHIEFGFDQITLTFKLTPLENKDLYPAYFDNFPWWTTAQIDQSLHATIPMYTGKLPAAGNMQQQVIDALKAMLAKQGVQGDVTSQTIADDPSTPGSPISMEFQLSGATLHVGSITLSPTGLALSKQINSFISTFSGSEYGQRATDDYLRNHLLDIYYSNGYLTAHVGDITTSPVKNGDAWTINLSSTITEGDVYHVAAINWAGSPEVPTADFQKKLLLHAGDVASVEKLRGSLSYIFNAYHQKGYCDAKVSAVPALNAAARTVAYTINVDPGEPFHLRSVQFLNLPPSQLADVQSTWKMQPGDLYNVDYVQDFLHNNKQMHSLDGYGATFKAVEDVNAHLIDLTLNFQKLQQGGL